MPQVESNCFVYHLNILRTQNARKAAVMVDYTNHVIYRCQVNGH